MKYIIAFLVCMISFSAFSEGAKAEKAYTFNASKLYNGTLLSGMHVPFVESAEIPVIIELQDKPENLDMCIAHGKVFPDITDERAYFKVYSVTCLTSEKNTVSNKKDIKGYVVDNSYFLGVSGRYIDRPELRTRVHQRIKDTLIAQNWSELFYSIKTLDELSPVLEISSGTPIKLFFADNVVLVTDSDTEALSAEYEAAYNAECYELLASYERRLP